MSGAKNFWARRKAAVTAETHAEQTALEAEAVLAEQTAMEAKSDEEVLLELDLPVPESLKIGDDFSVFMARAVPERLRRRALRTLWRSNPVLANVDNLVDYGEDYTDAAMVVPNMKTSYQVGRGLLKHIEALAHQAETAEQPVATEPAEGLEPDETQSVVDATPPSQEPQVAQVEAEEDASQMPRRMSFRIEETA